MRTAIGNGGWIGVDEIGLPGPLYVRVREHHGRLRVSEIYLDASDTDTSIDGQGLRVLPLALIESVANYHADAVRKRIGYPAPDLSTLASYFVTSFGNYPRQVAKHNWVVTSFAAQFGRRTRGVIADLDALPKVPRVRRAPRKWKGIRETDTEFRLPRLHGAGQVRMTDEFLRDVTKAYTAALARGERPNRSIADQTGYPLKSVQRWVYTARLKKIMPPGVKGRAS